MTLPTIASWMERTYNTHEGFDYFESGNQNNGVCWGAKKVDGTTLILLRGSVTFQDWIRDLMAITIPIPHGALGPLHPGFAKGMDATLAEILSHTTGPRILVGHSLGAARSAILTGLMVLGGVAPIARVCFGEPKPGFKTLAGILSHIPTFSFRNGDENHHDLVTDVPLSFPPEEYIHPNPLTKVSAPPPEGDRWGLFAYHHMSLYVEAVAGITGVTI